jgi:hypothetical protein
MLPIQNTLTNQQCLLIQEWPEEEYPPYANGPGYIISCDVADFIVAEFESHKLRVCCSVSPLLLFLFVLVCMHAVCTLYPHLSACLCHAFDLLTYCGYGCV